MASSDSGSSYSGERLHSKRVVEHGGRQIQSISSISGVAKELPMQIIGDLEFNVSSRTLLIKHMNHGGGGRTGLPSIEDQMPG